MCDDFFCLTIVQVAAIPEDVGTAGAIRAISHHLTAKDILVEYPSLPCL